MLFADEIKTVLLCTLNAKYIHSSLALRYLQTYCQSQTEYDYQIKEFTINQNTSDIMAEIYMNKPDVLGFSCYIWNIRQILELCTDYKKVAPDAIIVLGGPEVSYNSEQILLQNPSLDYIVRGEGEETLRELILAINRDLPLGTVTGITYRDGNQIFQNADRALMTDLDEIPFPYQNELDRLGERIIYYESSRGCPFRCTYCLSGGSGGVRYLSMERIKKDLEVMLGYQVREIKFVDRTFNCNEKRAMEIIDFIIAHRGTTKIHFEINADLFSDSMLEYLATVPHDLFNFEIGIQSTFTPALTAVRRKQNWDRLSHNIKQIKSQANIHLHLDLIAGLPGEDWENFIRSFNMVYNLEPDVLQLGFLKILKGSDLLLECESYDYMYQSQSPYQVLSNRDLKYEQIIALTHIEDILDKYYNSGDMKKTIAYIGEKVYFDNIFNFYSDFADFWQSRLLYGLGHRKEALYSILQKFIGEKHPSHEQVINELLKYDYLCHNHKYGLPEGLRSRNPQNINDLIYSYTKNAVFIAKHLPAFAAKTAREIKKLVHIEFFNVDPDTFEISMERLLMFVYNPISRTADKIIELSYPQDEGSAQSASIASFSECIIR